MKKTLKVCKVILSLSVLLVLLMSFISASLESDFLTLMNAERAKLGESPLYTNSNLTQAAYLHSKDMGDNNYFSHTSLDGRTFSERIVNAGYVKYSAIGENLAYSYGSADVNKAFNMWKESSGHYANMISNSYKEAGLGIYSINGLTYYTLDLGNRAGFVQPNLLNNTPPIINNTIPLPIVNNTPSSSNKSIFNYTQLTLSKTNYYKTAKISVKMNSKASMYYIFNNRERQICTSCTQFSISIQTKLNSNNLIELLAKNSSGVIERRLINF